MPITNSTALERRNCVEQCQRCHQLCLELLTLVAPQRGGQYVEPTHLRLLADCVQICEVTSDFMTRGSPYQSYVSEICAAICEATAESCRFLGDLDEVAESCERCATLCRQTVDA